MTIQTSWVEDADQADSITMSYIQNGKRYTIKFNCFPYDFCDWRSQISVAGNSLKEFVESQISF